jgi:GNAT superfamily N-acetyltransferase
MAKRESFRERIEVIPWCEFQKGIAPLWHSTDPATIPIFNNPYGIIQYDKKLWSSKIIYFPAKYVVNDTTVGYISIYNLSDIHIRPRGIYILPEYRGKGFGHRMQEAAWNLFPETFYRAFIWSREENVERFYAHSKMNVVPGGSNIWSDYSEIYMFFMYRDRHTKPTAEEIKHNQLFLEKYQEGFSLGGTNNLNNHWNDEQWSKYFREHEGSYIHLNINLDF